MPKSLTEIIPWRKTFWVKNYAKTITTTNYNWAKHSNDK